jgi:hypothetical protein
MLFESRSAGAEFITRLIRDFGSGEAEFHPIPSFRLALALDAEGICANEVDLL